MCVGVQRHAPVALPLGDAVSIVKEAGWSPGGSLMFYGKEKISPPPPLQMNLETQDRSKYTDPLLVAGKMGNMLKICTECCRSVCCCLHTITHIYYGGESTEKFHLWHRHRTWSSSLMLLMLSFHAKVARFLTLLLHPATQIPTARSLFPEAFLATAWLGSHVCRSLCLPTAIHSLRKSQPNNFTGCRCAELRILPPLCAECPGILEASTSWSRVPGL